MANEALELLARPTAPPARWTLDPDARPDDARSTSPSATRWRDRILGDERNYAGWSFVQPGDFGQLRYGSPLMNVTFDPAPFHGQLCL